jgi:hypothetical protein
MNGRTSPPPIDAPGYDSGGRGVVVLTLAAALLSLLFIFFSLLKALLSRCKSG